MELILMECGTPGELDKNTGGSEIGYCRSGNQKADDGGRERSEHEL